MLTEARLLQKSKPLDEHIKLAWVQPAPDLLLGEVKVWADTAKVQMEKVHGYWYDKKGFDTKINQKPSPGEKVLYYIHGGGFVVYSSHPRDMLSYLPNSLLDVYPSFKRAFGIEFRLTTGPPLPHSNPFPAALLDVLSGYFYLVNQVGFAPENIVVVGDSGGGSIALSLVRYLNETSSISQKIPAPPAALILMSPWCDLGTSHNTPGGSLETHLSSDITSDVDEGVFLYARLNYCGVLGFPSAADTNPYISPASIHPDMKISFRGFPPTFIAAGSAEAFVDQIRELARKMILDMGKDRVHYHEEEDAVHNYATMDFWAPEGPNTHLKIGAWLSSVLRL